MKKETAYIRETLILGKKVIRRDLIIVLTSGAIAGFIIFINLKNLPFALAVFFGAISLAFFYFKEFWPEISLQRATKIMWSTTGHDRINLCKTELVPISANTLKKIARKNHRLGNKCKTYRWVITGQVAKDIPCWHYIKLDEECFLLLSDVYTKEYALEQKNRREQREKEKLEKKQKPVLN